MTTPRTTAEMGRRERRGLRDLLPLAEERGGVFSARQAHEVGVTDRMLTYYNRRGDLERVGHGIYHITHLPHHRLEDVIVACLWAGDRAAASHETALVVYELSDAMPAAVHVTQAQPFRGKRPDVVVHHAPLTEAEVSVRDGVPVTSVARTLCDVAERSPELARQALHEALQRGDVSERSLRRAAEGYPPLAQLLAAATA